MGDDFDKIVILRPDKNGGSTSNLLGRAIRSMRRDRKMSQQVLGDIIGVSGVLIEQMETNAAHVSAVNLEKIAHAFDVEISEFFKAEYEANTGWGSENDLATLETECMHLIQSIDDVKGLLLIKDALLKLCR